MPKKFQGTNSKAEAARARKAETKGAEKAKKEKDLEDKYWQNFESGDKNEAKKRERKEDKEKKRLEQLEKKKAARQLLEEEESKLKGKSTVSSAKMTRSEISTFQEKETEKRKAAAAASKLEKKNICVNENPPEENINQIVAETLATEDGMEARNVEEAIAVLTVQQKTEAHPERRMKAAFAAFEEVRLPQLKAKNPNMRLSQIKQLLRKEWMKSPENPLNQNYVAYNSKT